MPASLGRHYLLGKWHYDSLVGVVQSGDIIYGNATPKWARLPKGEDGQYLALVGGFPAWTSPPAGAAHNLLSVTHPDTLPASPVRGDMLVGNLTPVWARLPIGLAGRVLKSDGVDAGWGQVDHAELVNVLPNQHHAQLHKASHEAGGGDALTALDAGIITSGILAAARGGLARALSPTWTNDYILVYKTATDQWVMEPKPAGGAGVFTLLGEARLTAAATSISVDFAGNTREMLHILFLCPVSDETSKRIYMRFNDDAGANYSFGTTYWSTNLTLANQTQIDLSGVADPSSGYSYDIWVYNRLASQMKIYGGAGGCGRASETYCRGVKSSGIWQNTTDQITRVTILASAGNLPVGATLLVEGRNLGG